MIIFPDLDRVVGTLFLFDLLLISFLRAGFCRILVLEGGRLMEFDTPAALLSDPNSAFYKMAKDAGLV